MVGDQATTTGSIGGQPGHIKSVLRGRGRISRSYTVWCGRCDFWMHATGNPTRDALRNGWHWTRRDGWICADCFGS